MKHLKNNCTAHDMAIAECGLACANCGMCKCGKTHNDEPVEGKIYALTGGSNDKCISNGNTWSESEVK